ncbi:hypothetical protein [Ruegeria arenilitoris]|uniref:hypothetical protein n=1 Tax=Ruegeria arenilitoris TaxID=1173585 RepID=UPI001479ECB6|nr:hypothetical protein [Ruegeria arenilitoris]
MFGTLSFKLIADVYSLYFGSQVMRPLHRTGSGIGDGAIPEVRLTVDLGFLLWLRSHRATLPSY